MSLGARIVIAVFALLFGAIMFLHGTTADPDKSSSSYAFGAFCVFIGAASLLNGRPAQFCGSVVGSCVFVAAIIYLGHELLSGPVTSGSLGRPSIINACLFLVVFGLPGIFYAANAKFGLGKAVPQQGIEPDEPGSGGSAG